MWCLSSGGICASDKSHREMSWSSGNAFGKFVALGEMVASKTGKRAFGKLFELFTVPHHSSSLVTVLIPLSSSHYCGLEGIFSGCRTEKHFSWVSSFSFWYSQLKEKYIIMIIFVDCVVWVEVMSYEPYSHLNFIIAKNC